MNHDLGEENRDPLMPSDDRLDTAVGRLVQLGGVLAALAIISMTLLVLTNITFRLLPGVRGLNFIEDYTGYLFVAVAFLGLADTFTSGNHVRVTLILGRLKGHARAIVEILVTIVALVIMGWLTHVAIEMFLKSWESGVRAQTVVQTPLWIPRAAMVPGCVLFMLVLLLHLRRNIRRLFAS